MNHEQFRRFMENNCVFDEQTYIEFEAGFESDYRRFNPSQRPKEIDINSHEIVNNDEHSPITHLVEFVVFFQLDKRFLIFFLLQSTIEFAEEKCFRKYDMDVGMLPKVNRNVSECIGYCISSELGVVSFY